MSEKPSQLPKGPKNRSEDETRQCPNCGGTNIITSPSKELVCFDCGLVLQNDVFELGAEWREFSPEERMKRARAGPPSTLTMHDKGLSTNIDWRDVDARGHRLDAKRRAEMQRIRKWHNRSRVYQASERNLASAMSELDRLAGQLDLPQRVRQTAALLYRQALEKNLIRGRSIEAIVAACIYAACRRTSFPRTLTDVGRYTRVGRKELGRSYRLIVRRLSLQMPVTQPEDFVSRFANALHLTQRAQARTLEILMAARSKGITSGKDPTCLAAAAIYIASILEGERRTQREIGEIARVTEVTVRNRYKELVRALNLGIEV
ncbi:MAG: transcription initiation factor IIB [Promethearchaeota archaeon]